MTASGLDEQKRWASWTLLFIDRVPLPYRLTVALATMVLLVEQVMEDSFSDPGLGQLLTPAGLSARLAIPLVFLYAMTMVKVLRGTALTELGDLQPAVQLSTAEYDDYVRKMVGTSQRTQSFIGLASVAIVILLWGIVGLPLPVNANTYLPQNTVVAVFILACYVLFAWGALTLVFVTFQFGVSLGALARCPLAINIFDSENLLPFGRLSVVNSLSTAGVIVILLIFLGPPVTSLAWSVVILASVASLMALLLPLWGVHQQMSHAKTQALVQLHQQFKECQSLLLHSSDAAIGQLGAISDQIETLTRLRKMVMGAPSWPFRDFGAIVKALVAAMSPLVYVVITEAIRAYLKNFIR